MYEDRSEQKAIAIEMLVGITLAAFLMMEVSK